ncbi:MAG: putative rane protein, partial [Actinobacteria bacterium]|nr:putative rane protein [Actinomycetota bacterium]
MAVQEAAPASSGVIDLGPVRRTAAPPLGPRRFLRHPGTLIFLAAFGLYAVVAALLVFRYSSFANDAQARTANAYYVMFSRDPHLAAIGFVWNPLPSLSVMPVLALKVLWPALARRALAGNLVSAVFMAGAVVEVAGILRDLRARPWLVAVLTACFALHPMIVLYGANGMSEAIFLFTLLVCARQLALWLGSGELRPLVIAAIALAFAYLARNEAAAAAGAATLLVATVTLVRTAGDRRYRTMTAVVDATVFAAPFAVAFVGWALASWIIVGHPFEQFSSVYGTASQLRVINASGGAGPSGPGHVVRQLAALVPLLPVIAGLAALRTVRRRDPRSLAHVAVFGAVVAFAVVAA